MALDVLGFGKIPFLKQPYPEKIALNNVSLDIKKGERVGIIGRNGAGKTTLLKLIAGLIPTQKGNIAINGRVNILMTSGLGFHPEMTGYQNIKNSLILNGLSKDKLQEAIDDVIDFCELGEYINQPIKTYSLGMTSRLAFATSTAIKPEILIIDEVLGSGDAYFLAKSANRIKKLTDSKESTLLLVSHSNGQILKFCERCVWLEKGEIVDDGPSLEIVKKYDKKIVEQIHGEASSEQNSTIYRWKSRYDDFKIESFKILDAYDQEKNIFFQNDDLVFQIEINNQKCSDVDIYPVVFIYDLQGTTVTFKWTKISSTNRNIKVRLKIPSPKLGKNEYVISVGVYKTLDLYNLNNSEFYDNIDRSYKFKVLLKDPYNDPSLVNFDSEWVLE